MNNPAPRRSGISRERARQSFASLLAGRMVLENSVLNLVGVQVRRPGQGKLTPIAG